MPASTSIKVENLEPALKRVRYNEYVDVEEDAAFNRLMMELQNQNHLQQPSNNLSYPTPPPQQPHNQYNQRVNQPIQHYTNVNRATINAFNKQYTYPNGSINTNQQLLNNPNSEDLLNDEINRVLLNLNEFNDSNTASNSSKELPKNLVMVSNQIPNSHNPSNHAYSSLVHSYGGEQNVSIPIHNSHNSNNELSALSSSASPSNLSPFDSPDTVTSSVSSQEDETNKKYKNSKNATQEEKNSSSSVNMSTITSIKNSMMNTSKLMSTFTTLKTTYLKLCKEFNYLLGKFNDNERIKIELINENNELKSLLMDIITKRELERKSYKKLQSYNTPEIKLESEYLNESKSRKRSASSRS